MLQNPWFPLLLVYTAHETVCNLFQRAFTPLLVFCRSPSASVLLGFMLDLLRLAARESGNLRDFEAGTPSDDPLGQLEGEEVTVCMCVCVCVCALS